MLVLFIISSIHCVSAHSSEHANVVSDKKLVIHTEDHGFCSSIDISFYPLTDDDDYEIVVKGYIDDEHVVTCKDDHHCKVRMQHVSMSNNFKYEIKTNRDGTVKYNLSDEPCPIIDYPLVILASVILFVLIMAFVCVICLMCLQKCYLSIQKNNEFKSKKQCPIEDTEEVVEVTLYPAKNSKIPTDTVTETPGNNDKGAEELQDLV